MICVVFNSPYIGGAERSIIYQIRKEFNQDFKLIIPSIEENDTEELITFLKEKLNCLESQVKIIKFPLPLYRVSRSAGFMISFYGLLFLPFFVNKIKSILNQSDVIWCNGNKVGLPFYLAAKLINYKGRFLWHFRDYPSRNPFYQRIWDYLGNEKFDFICIGNSESVRFAIKEATRSRVKTKRMYNPVGDLNNSIKRTNKIKTLGCASMLAPWKGVHEVIMMSLLYESELIELGVEEINIYGDAIYKTYGEHNGYPEQIKIMAMKSKLINFKGKQTPELIYDEIDVLIHSSIKSEPFGRIIVEAFKRRVPVVSTSLGGASELVIDEVTGLKYIPNHYNGLFKAVKKLVIDETLRDLLVDNAQLKLDQIEVNIHKTVRSLIS